jgi:CubicO group peptidase (beta-lactamase class C family)
MRRIQLCLVPLLALFAFVSCKTPELIEPPRPVFHTEKLAEMDAAVLAAIEEKRLPGGVLWVERSGEIYHKCYGQRALLPESEPMSLDTIFDAASLTKVVATTPAVMLLIERGRMELDAPVARYISEFTGDGRDAITVRHLLTHTSGLRAGISLQPAWQGYDRAVQLAVSEKPNTTPGTAFRYSDVNYILLGELVRKAGGMRLDEFAHWEIFRPLKMHDTGFVPHPSRHARTAPTERSGDTFLRGQVHDPTARRMGGVAGHAGLFTTSSDLARFARMMLQRGTLDGVRLFRPETVALMTSVQSPSEVSARRGLGWDIDSPFSGPRGKLFPLGSYGHTGWTGTSMWIDPFSESFIIFLSNRNHPDEKGSVIALRAVLGTLAAEAVNGFDFKNVPGALPRPTPAKSLPSAAAPHIAESS